jgi:NAD(P)-dependent dehydrogenase (short-subunit alcohol dehydrogenase family)
MSANKIALVTGVSSGIGRAIANLLAAREFRVFGTTRKPAEADGRAANFEIIPLDVRDEESVHRAVRTVLDKAGQIDALVNNAGYALIGALEETSVEEAKQLFDTNLFGILRTSQAVLPVMREQQHGRILNVGSVVGLVPAPYQGIYSASKHALEGLSESLDHETRQFGVRVSVIEPGFVRTNIAQNTQQTQGRLAVYDGERDRVREAVRGNVASGADPNTVAVTVLEALQDRSPRQHYLVGREARLSTWLRKFVPETLFDRGLRKQFGLLGT